MSGRWLRCAYCHHYSRDTADATLTYPTGATVPVVVCTSCLDRH